MTGKRTVDEWALENFLQCPVRLGEMEFKKNSFALGIDLAFQDVILRKLETGFIYTLPDLRAKIEQRIDAKKWKYPASTLLMVPKIARRLLEISGAYRVLQAVVPYIWKTNEKAITGEYAILGKLAGVNRHKRFIVKLTDKKVIGPTAPSLVSMARWRHAIYGEDESLFQVMNFNIVEEAVSFQTFHKDTTQLFITAASSAYQSSYVYPIPGVYCESCKTKNCMKAIVNV